ncbi:hypothetical protein MKQ68_01295 [Chitinophaga horti]|uniref:WxL domain-containing protein n=1 Tax=Chitinophaga horti TaxID=2920382 RepID=A0ABY6J2W1_9BACT|nr:hypothetical protein [Chitinophaga horti]UYQ93736.1 hypothetical protein MKQ68_01295 [Chitinophaga horti]
MKRILYITQTFTLSCVLSTLLILGALKVSANDAGLISEDDKTKTTKKTEVKLNLSAMPKKGLSLDAGFKYSGILNSEFKLIDNNTVNVKSIMTYKKGNVTYVVPYSFQVPQQAGNKYHQLQINLPLRRG